MITQVKSEDYFYKGGCFRTTVRNNLIQKLTTGFTNWLKNRETRRRDRKAIKHLSQLSEKDLRDIGITHDAVIWASKLPSDQSATMALQLISRRRSGQTSCHAVENSKQGEK